MGAFSLIVVINLLNRCDMTSSGETDEHSSPSTSKLMQCTEEGCEETFRKKTQLRHHLSEKHKITVLLKSYECPSCKKCFATNQRLKRHQKTHNAINVNHVILLIQPGQSFESTELYIIEPSLLNANVVTQSLTTKLHSRSI